MWRLEAEFCLYMNWESSQPYFQKWFFHSQKGGNIETSVVSSSERPLFRVISYKGGPLRITRGQQQFVCCFLYLSYHLQCLGYFFLSNVHNKMNTFSSVLWHKSSSLMTPRWCYAMSKWISMCQENPKSPGVCMLNHFSHVKLFATLRTIACQTPFYGIL